jgi:hypothetical protein
MGSGISAEDDFYAAIYALLVSNDKLYIGGYFDFAGTSVSPNLVAAWIPPDTADVGLQVSSSVSTGGYPELRLAWSADRNCVLECSTSIGARSDWTPVTNPVPQLIEGQRILSLPAKNSLLYFRLNCE